MGDLGMIASDEFSQYYAELLQGTYDCVDRIVLNAFYPLGQTGGGVRSWWRRLYGDDSNLDDEHLREMAGTFSRRLHAFCAKQGIPIIEAQARDRKHELAQPYEPNDPKVCGLFCVIKSNAPAPVWEVSYDLTVFKIKWGNLTLEIYDKGGRVLRIEVVVHNAKELRCGKMLEKLPALLERMRDMLVRFLGTVQAAHVSFLDEGAFEGLSEPTTRGTRRLAGIDLNKARNRHVVDAVVALSTRPNGFTVAQLAESRTAALRSGSQHVFGTQRGLRRGKTGRQDAGPSDRAIASLRSRSSRSADSVCLPPPTRESHQAPIGRRRPSLSQAAQSQRPLGSSLRRATPRTPSNL